MQLLVSVVSETEVAAAVEGGADIVDVKNPREGSLGANFPHVIRRVREITPPEIPVSAAIGDVPNLPGTVALAALGAAMCLQSPAGFQYVKVGLASPRNRQEAVFLLRQVCRAVRGYDPNIQIIATAYADAHKINALLPLDLPAVAVEAGVDGCLLDTARKGQGTLLTHLGEDELYRFVAGCRAANMLCALAGSVGEEDLPRVCQFDPDVVGVRTAACRGDRIKGRVDRGKVRRLKALLDKPLSRLSSPSPATPPPVLASGR